MKRYLETANKHIKSWRSKGLSDEKFSSVIGYEYPNLRYHNSKINIKFDGSVLKQNKITRSGSIVGIYSVYRLTPRTKYSSIFLENCLSGAIKIENTSNPDPDKYKYSGWICIGFDSKDQYTHSDGYYGKNAIIFGADLENSKHATNRTKDVLVLCRGLIQKIDDTTIYAEKMYVSNFTVSGKTFCLSLHYNGDNSYLFVNGKEFIKFKAKDFEPKHVYPMCLGNISVDFNQADRKSTDRTELICLRL